MEGAEISILRMTSFLGNTAARGHCLVSQARVPDSPISVHPGRVEIFSSRVRRCYLSLQE
jgi:hypothetical protein